MPKSWRKGLVKDEIGNRYGRLIVTKRNGYYTSPKGNPQATWDCQCDCGAIATVTGGKLRFGHTKSCGCLQTDTTAGRVGERSPVWKGGRVLAGGYVKVRIPEHPAASNGYVLEHRVVMEKILGRYLDGDETVHHINGNKCHNDPKNLELWVSRHPKGQRVRDLVTWAKEIIAQYDIKELN